MSVDAARLRRLDVRLEERADLLRDAARDVPDLPTERREELRARVLAFLRKEVLEHLAADEQTLYPLVAERLGDPLVTAPMRYDHRAIRWWIGEIARVDVADTAELQRLLYGMHALIRVHLSKEEDLYVALLESPGWPAGA